MYVAKTTSTMKMGVIHKYVTFRSNSASIFQAQFRRSTFRLYEYVCYKNLQQLQSLAGNDFIVGRCLGRSMADQMATKNPRFHLSQNATDLGYRFPNHFMGANEGRDDRTLLAPRS